MKSYRLKPAIGLIGLFQYQTNLRNELRLRPGAAGCSVVGRDRCRCVDELRLDPSVASRSGIASHSSMTSVANFAVRAMRASAGDPRGAAKQGRAGPGSLEKQPVSLTGESSPRANRKSFNQSSLANSQILQ
jgi:hypothetical protein